MPALTRRLDRRPGIGVKSCVSSRGLRTGKNEQSAATLPFRTQVWINVRVRTGHCYRDADNRQNECNNAQRSRTSPDEIHEHSSRHMRLNTVTLRVTPDTSEFRSKS